MLPFLNGRAALLFFLAMMAAAGASAQPIVGQPTVVDGDTLIVQEQRVRLWGIDAPEAQQSCVGANGKFQCGTEATRYMQGLVAGNGPATCSIKTIDRYKRPVAVCLIQGRDLGAAMVLAGWALAFVRYSNDYVGAEADARQARRGMWAGSFEAPWEWRAGKRQRE